MGRSTTVALTGNTFIAQPLRRIDNPRFLQTVDFLRQADVTLTNLECSLPDPETPPAFVAGSGWGATYMVGRPGMLDDLRFLVLLAVGGLAVHRFRQLEREFVPDDDDLL